MREAFKRQTKEEVRAKVSSALDSIEKGVEALTTSSDWQRMLSQMSKFHNYSFGNSMLIAIQRPDATFVAGFRTWEKLGRHVKKGEKGIMILAPSSYRKTVEVEGPTGEIEQQEKRGVYFRPVYVFDIKQTEGEPLALTSMVKPLEGQNAEADAAIITIAEWLGKYGIPVEREPMSELRGGYYSPAEQKIVLNSNQEPLHQFKTLMHEVAHLLLHTPDDQRKIDFQHRQAKSLKDLTRDLMETEAESTAYVVLNALGIDSAQYSFGYVTKWSGGKREVVSAVATRVREAADYILSNVLGVSDTADTEQAVEASAAEFAAGEYDSGDDFPTFYGYEPEPEIYAIETGDWDVVLE